MKKNAFTLIELLVAVSIIVVLIGVLLPAMAAAKASSSRAVSANSLSQLIMAGRLYLADNNNNFWPYSQAVSGGTMWWFGYETYQSQGMKEGQRYCDYSQGPLGPYAIAGGGVKTDPALLRFSPRLKPKYADGNYGYGYNTILGADSTGKPRNATSIDYPSQIVVFATCAQVNTFQPPATAKNPMIEEFYMINDTTVSVHFRHGRNALVAFLDGSVRPLSMDTDMQPGTQDQRIPTANIGTLKSNYYRQTGW